MTKDFESIVRSYQAIADQAVEDALRMASELEQEQQRADKLSAQLAAATAELNTMKGRCHAS